MSKVSQEDIDGDWKLNVANANGKTSVPIHLKPAASVDSSMWKSVKVTCCVVQIFSI